MKILILNGPNLNLLGQRQPEIYGRQTFETYFETLQLEFPGVTMHYFQSNHEGELIDKLHEAGFSYAGIVLNPGGLAHSSVALADAVSAIETPVVEVHISNIYARESFRSHSFLSHVCVGCISGLGLKGYELAITYLLS